jgi:hypothetical protein
MQRIQDKCQEELPAFGFYFVTGTEPLVSTFILGHVERKRRIGVRHVWDRDRSKLGEDGIEHLPVEVVSRSSVRQHRDREIRIWQNPQTSLLTDGAAVVRVDRLAVPMRHGETQGPLRSEPIASLPSNSLCDHVRRLRASFLILKDAACSVPPRAGVGNYFFGRPTLLTPSASKYSVVPKGPACSSKKLLTLSIES